MVEGLEKKEIRSIDKHSKEKTSESLNNDFLLTKKYDFVTVSLLLLIYSTLLPLLLLLFIIVVSSIPYSERRWSKDKSQKLREKRNHFLFLSLFCCCSHSTEPKHPQLSEAAFLSHSISTIALVLWCVFQSQRSHLYVSNFPSQNDFVSPFFKLSIA